MRNILRRIIVLLAALAAITAIGAQPSAADRKYFADVKARAEKGDAEAQFALGNFYVSGLGVTPDPGKGVKWHRKAAEQGLAAAQLQLGVDYMEGLGVKPDKTEALRWVRAAADQGIADAQLNCGYLLSKGEGAPPSAVDALQYFRKAADQKLAQAEYEVGRCYLEGSGAAKDIEEGVKWIRRSAWQGYSAAQNRLGLCFFKGEGLPKDNVEAYRWFNLAAGQGGADMYDARINLSKVEALLTAEEIAQAQRLAREFKPQQEEPAPSLGVTADAAKFGTITVKAPDDTFDVFADGQYVGNAPAKLRLSEGRHVIEVKKAGFQDFRREINIADGAELNLRAAPERQ